MALAAALAGALCGCGEAKGPGGATEQRDAAGRAAPGSAGPARKTVATIPGDAVALVNGAAIGTTQFAAALRDAAFAAKSATFAGRSEVLDGLVSRELLLQEARARGLERAPAVVRAVERIRRESVYRQLKVKIAGDSLAVGAEEVEKALGQLPRVLELSVLLADEGDVAEDLVRRIRAGEAIDDLARQRAAELGQQGVRRRTVLTRAGSTMYPPEVEAALFTMGPGAVAAYATPVGHLVVRVESRRDLSEEEVAAAREKVREQLIEKKLIGTQTAMLDDRRKEFPVKRLIAAFRDQPPATADPLETWRTFDATPFATVGPVTLTLGDVYRDLGDYELAVKLTKEMWDKVFDEAGNTAIAKALYYLEGKRLKLSPLPADEAAIAERMPTLLVNELSTEVALAVKRAALGPEQCAELLEKGRGRRYLKEERANLRQIIVRREEQAQAVLARLRGGEEFAKVAREVSLDPSAKAGGDLGWLTATQMAKFFTAEGARAILKDASTGSRAPGTLRTTKGYHVILASGYQPAGEGGFEDAGAALLDDCLRDQRRKAVEKAAADLRAKAAVAIDEQKVATIPPLAGTPADAVHKGGISPSGPKGASPHGGGAPHGGGFPGGGANPHRGAPPARP